jgi:hypothetical protein
LAIFYNSSIVTNGLVLCLDAGNSKSYPGSGTVWTDLSGRGINGTLTNGPTYSSSNGGVLTFDGTDDFVNCGTSPFPAGNISVFAWIYPTSFNSIWNVICTKWFNPTGNDFHWSLKSSSENGTNLRQNLYFTSNGDFYGTTSFSTNTWYHIGFTLVNGVSFTYYKNGVADGGVGSASRTPQSSRTQIGDDRGIQYGLIGKIPQVSIYNRALSAAEIQQNYLATKSRYF